MYQGFSTLLHPGEGSGPGAGREKTIPYPKRTRDT